VKSGGRGLFAVRAHPDTLERVGTFLDLLVATAHANGFGLENTDAAIALGVDGERVPLSITQVIRRSRHEATAEELARQERWDRRHRGDWDAWDRRPTVPYYDFVPTGAMTVEIGGWPRPAGVTRRYADSARRKVEQRLPEILSSARAHAAYQVEWRKERQAERARDEEARARRQREQEEARRQQQRAEFLADLLERERQRRELAALLATVRGEDSSRFAEWARRRLAVLAATLEWSEVEAEAGRLRLWA